MVLTTEQKNDIRTLLVYKSKQTGENPTENDPELIALMTNLGDSMIGTAFLQQLIEESRIHKESISE